MKSLYTVAEILEATGGRAENVRAEGVSSISIDSRDILPDALFVAIKGDRFDGHEFVRTAIEAGAAAALVSEGKLAGLEGLPLIVVPDALKGLEDIARFSRKRSDATIIGVTGSVGKTSTKELLRQVLEEAGETHASIKSFNNHWGVPLMLARMPQHAKFGVFEIGMSASGEIEPLSRLVRPDIVVITAIAPAHMENFESLSDIARAKAEIFAGLDPQGWAIINADHSELDVLKQSAETAHVSKVMTYGYANNPGVTISAVESFEGGTRAQVNSGSFQTELSISSKGQHRMANAVGAMLAAITAGVSQDTVLSALKNVREVEGRGAEIHLHGPSGDMVVIDESYNANPLSMAASLEVFAQYNPVAGRKVLVLGDMLELGEQSAALHAALAQNVLSSGAAKVFLVGAEMAALADALDSQLEIVYSTALEGVVEDVLKSLDYGDVVMVKGSNSMKLGSLVSRIRESFGTPSSA